MSSGVSVSYGTPLGLIAMSAGRAVDARDVAERPDDEAAARQVQVRPVDRLAQRAVGPPGNAHARPAASRSRMASSRFMSVPRSAVAPATPPNASCSSR